jgi:uridylate kinase
MKIVIDIGGSVLCPEGVPDVEYIKKFSKFILDLKKRNHKIIIVTGGGKLCRNYVNACRSFNASESYLDLIGITATRLNAMALISALKNEAFLNPVKNFEELAEAVNFDKIVVMGGLIPGQTTDAVAAEVADFIDADILLIATNVKGVYDKDPKKFKDVKIFKKMSGKDLFRISMSDEFLAGKSSIVDPVAAKLILRLKAKTIILDGRDIKNMEKAIEGKKFIGTIIV